MVVIRIRFLLLTLVVVMSPIYGGKELMIRECHNAGVPAICMQCLESDAASFRADSVGIAGIVVHCLDSHLQTLTNDITKLLSKKDKGDDAIRTALEGCLKDLPEATAKLADARNGLKTGNYDKAGHSVYLALGYPLGCRDNLHDAKFDFSPFYTQIDIYAQLSDAAMRIIDRF